MQNNLLHSVLQHLAPQKILTRFAGWLAESRSVWLKNLLINYFIKRYPINLAEAWSDNLADYPSFNSFFTRKLKPGLRAANDDPAAIVSPADGCISQIGPIKGNSLIQAKGYYFDLINLLGGDTALAERFKDGQFATIYLAPHDYHRVHMPFPGKLEETIFVPGKLFSVNHQTAASVTNLFSRNERLVCIFDTSLGKMAVILVGAMLVGSINTAWGDTPCSPNISRKTYSLAGANSLLLNRGEEIGHFKMGSTAILLFEKNQMQWANHLQENTLIKMGELLGSLPVS